MNPLELLQNTAKLKANVDKVKDELALISAEGSSGGKMVTVTMNGRLEMTAIHLDPICVDNRDVKMLEDLIVSAYHSARENAEELVRAKLGPMVGPMLNEIGIGNLAL